MNQHFRNSQRDRRGVEDAAPYRAHGSHNPARGSATLSLLGKAGNAAPYSP